MKSYTIKTPYATYENCFISTDTYRANNALAVEIWNEEDGPIATLTVCLPDEDIPLGDNWSFVDTNNCPWAPKFLEDNGLGKFVGCYGFSGFCMYPLFNFDLEKLKS